MQIEDRSLEANDSATHWFAPLAMLVAWLAQLFDHIARMKRVRRTTRFKPDWADNWSNLRRLEWLRDQILAAGAAQLLSGQPLDLDQIIPSTEPPETYGGPCPRTPFEMNRRFLAFARWHADPEAAIRRHAARIAKRAGSAKAPAPLASLSRPATGVGVMRASCVHDGGGLASARGPPPHSQNLTTHLARPAREIAPACPQRRTGLSTPP